MNWYREIAHYFPIFHVSDDDQFGDIGATTKKENLRYSLIAIWLGKYLIHVLSIKKGKPSLVKVLNLDVVLDKAYEVDNESNKKSVEESIKEYTEALNKYDEKTIRDHIEALKIKSDEEQNRRSTTLNKTAVYNAALLVFLTIVFPFLLKIYQIRSYITISMLIIGAIFYASALLLSFKMLEVSGLDSFTFNEVFKSQDSMRSLASGLYYRYRYAQSAGDRIVSYNTNLQKNIRQFLAWSVICVLIINVQSGIESHYKSPSQLITTYQFNLNEDKINNVQSITRIEEVLLTGVASQVIISGGEEQQREKVRGIIDIFNTTNTSVNVLDSSNSPDISVIIIKGDPK